MYFVEQGSLSLVMSRGLVEELEDLASPMSTSRVGRGLVADVEIAVGCWHRA
jgi:hypothetical protein